MPNRDNLTATVIRMWKRLAFALMLVGCTRPSSELLLTVRQTVLPGRRPVEVIVRPQQLEVTVTAVRMIVNRQIVAISTKRSEELRRLFWKS